jgi:hypothetical protein
VLVPIIAEECGWLAEFWVAVWIKEQQIPHSTSLRAGSAGMTPRKANAIATATETAIVSGRQLFAVARFNAA